MSTSKIQYVASTDIIALERIAKNPPHAVLLVCDSFRVLNDGRTLLRNAIIEYHPLSDNDTYSLEQSSGTIEEVRELRRQLNQKFSESEMISKIVEITNITKYSEEAQSAILKLLEEPNKGILFIITANDIQDVLHTITSRTIVITLKQPSTKDILGLRSDVDEARVVLAQKLARGKFDKVLSYLDGDSIHLETAKQILGAAQYDRLLHSDGLAKNREQSILVIEYIQAMLLHLAEETIKKSGDAETYIERIHLCEKSISYLKTNANAKLILDNLFVKL